MSRSGQHISRSTGTTALAQPYQPAVLELAERLRVKRREVLADGIMDSAILVRNESLRPIEQQIPPDLHNQAVTHALEYAAALPGQAHGAGMTPSHWPT